MSNAIQGGRIANEGYRTHHFSQSEPREKKVKDGGRLTHSTQGQAADVPEPYQMSEISFLFFMPTYGSREFPHAIMQRVPISRSKAHCEVRRKGDIPCWKKLKKRKIGKLYTREHPESQSAIKWFSVCETARKADGGTACLLTATVLSLCRQRTIQSF